MKLMALHKRGLLEGIGDEAADEAVESDDPKGSLIALIVTHAVVQERERRRQEKAQREEQQRKEQAEREEKRRANADAAAAARHRERAQQQRAVQDAPSVGGDVDVQAVSARGEARRAADEQAFEASQAQVRQRLAARRAAQQRMGAEAGDAMLQEAEAAIAEEKEVWASLREQTFGDPRVLLRVSCKAPESEDLLGSAFDSMRRPLVRALEGLRIPPRAFATRAELCEQLLLPLGERLRQGVDDAEEPPRQSGAAFGTLAGAQALLVEALVSWVQQPQPAAASEAARQRMLGEVLVSHAQHAAPE